MAFWNARRGTSETVSAGSAALASEPHLEAIEVFMEDGRTGGWMVAIEERILDFLIAHPLLRICVDPRADMWQSVSRDDILLVAPPPLPSSNPRRIHRQKRRVRAVVGPYSVVGVYHVPPGALPDAYIQRARPPFIALTDAVVTTHDEAAGELYEVVIVNAQRLEGLTALLSPV
jgi:hypothetical protein